MQNCFRIFNLTISYHFFFFLKITILLSLFVYCLLVGGSNLIKKNFFLIVFSSFTNKVILNFIQLRKKKNFFFLISLECLLILILVVNYLGFIPFSLCLSAHIRITIPLGVIIFSYRLIILGRVQWKNFFLHLVIRDVPLGLAPILILIESVGVLIRPLTLSVRLAANMTAGHLIIFIIRSLFIISSLDMVIIFFLFFIFILEFFVGLIQSYVFSMLSVMYITRRD